MEAENAAVAGGSGRKKGASAQDEQGSMDVQYDSAQFGLPPGWVVTGRRRRHSDKSRKAREASGNNPT